MEKNKLLVVVGPTAIGKTDLSVMLAKQFNGEVISADSRQVYKGMDIGTGKVTEAEKQGIPHYLLDICHPSGQFSAAEFAKLARKTILEISSKHKIPIICGGTGFYISSVIDNVDLPEVPPDWALREELGQLSLENLQEELRKIDNNRWERMNQSDRSNPRRLIRAIEIVKATGKGTTLKTNRNEYETLIIGLTTTKEVLKERIKKRLEKRLQEGMIEEIKRLHDEGVTWERLEDFGLEYRWIARFLQGKVTSEQMFENLYKDIVDFARRQMVWFNRDSRINWFDITEEKWENKVENLVSDWYFAKDAAKN